MDQNSGICVLDIKILIHKTQKYKFPNFESNLFRLITLIHFPQTEQ